MSEILADVKQLSDALKTLLLVVATSSVLQAVLSDALFVVREVVGNMAADVVQVASTVQAAAAGVENAVRPATTPPQDVSSQFNIDEISFEESQRSLSDDMAAQKSLNSSPAGVKAVEIGRAHV